MIRLSVLLILFAVICAGPARAVNTWAGSSAADMADEQAACAKDADLFCGGNTIFVFEMENCLKGHMSQLSKRCRKQLSPTNFKKYYQEEWHPFDGF